MKFRLKVHKMKCIKCDIISLIEVQESITTALLTCPVCTGDIEHMGDIEIMEPTRIPTKPGVNGNELIK